MATYVNDLRLKEIATGDEAGTWGTSTNTNLELIGEAFSFGTEAITTNADTHTTTIADGSTDPGRSMYLKYTGTLDSACTITIGPNTISKMWFIENATTGSQNIIISQGSGANITIPPGDTKAVYSDGAGSGAAFVDAFASLNVVDLKVQDDLTVTDDMTVGGTLGVTGVLTATSLDISGDIDVDGTTNLDVVDIDGAVDMASTLTVAGVLTGASLDISGDIDVDGTTNLDVVDIDGAVDMASTLAVGGVVTVIDGSTSAPSVTNAGDTNTGIYFPADDNFGIVVGGSRKLLANSSGVSINNGVLDADGGITVDNITIDGTQIDLSSGDLTLDVAGDIILDAAGEQVKLNYQGDTHGELSYSSQNFVIKSTVSDKDLIFKGNDNGSEITALTLDMSAAGTATFNHDVILGDDGKAIFGAGSDLQIYHDGSNSYIAELGTGNLSISGAAEVQIAKNDFAGNFEHMVRAIVDGAVELYHDGSLKLASSSTGIDVTGVITTDGLTTSADINFGDNDKAIFGAGSDLQIYHTGSQNYIEDAGTGNLNFKSNGNNFNFLDGSDNVVMQIDIDSETTLYHNTSAKLATASGGISVTGEVAATSLDISGDIDVDGVTNLDVVDIDGAVDMASTLAVGGVLTANAGVTSSGTGTFGILTVDDISINNASITSSGGITLDAPSNIVFDAGGANFYLKDDGTTFGQIIHESPNFTIKSTVSDGDLLFKGNDGGSTILALKLDMSAAGEATFNAGIKLGDGNAATFGAGGDLLVYHSSNENIIQTNTSDQDLLFRGNDGGSTITALTLDMSNAGKAAFNAGATFNSNVAITTADNSDTLTLVSTDADANGGPILVFDRTSGSPANNDLIGQIMFQARNNAAQDIDYAGIDSYILDVTDGSEDGELTITTIVAGTTRNRLDFTNTQTIVNESGIDVNFRVESSGNANMLFVDGGNNYVSIGHNTDLGGNLNVAGGIVATSGTTFDPDTMNSGTIFLGNVADGSGWGANGIGWNTGSVGDTAAIGMAGSSDPTMYVALGDGTNANSFKSMLVMSQANGVVINEDSIDADFRVESNDHEYKFFVDAQNNNIGIGTSSPDADVHIKQIGDIGNGNTQGLMLESGAGSQKYMLQTGRTGVSNAYFNLRDVTNTRDIFSVLDNDGKFQGHTPFEWNNAAVFNEGSQDYDFRVESNGNTHMLFVDGGNDAVGIGGTAVATSSLSVTGQYEEASGDGYDYNIALVPDVSLSIAQGKGTGILFQSEDTNSAARHAANIQSFRTASSASNYSNGLRFSVRPNGADMQEVLRLKSDEAVFNENSRDLDFRVESDADTHALFVNAGQNSIGMFSSSIGTEGSLHIGASPASGNQEGGQIILQSSVNGSKALHIDNYNNASIDFCRFMRGSDTGSEAVLGVWDITNTRFGIGTSTPAQTLTVAGSAWATGYYITALQGNAQLTNASTSSGSNASYIGQGLISVTVSDKKVKENFGSVETNECLNKVVSLAEHVKKFDWIDEDWKKEKGRTVGMVAQEIYEDHSEFVHKPENYDDDGWAIRYQEIVPTLTKAIQEQQTLIETLTARITALENA